MPVCFDKFFRGRLFHTVACSSAWLVETVPLPCSCYIWAAPRPANNLFHKSLLSVPVHEIPFRRKKMFPSVWFLRWLPRLSFRPAVFLKWRRHWSRTPLQYPSGFYIPCPRRCRSVHLLPFCPLYRLFNIFCPVIFMCQRRVRQVQVIAQFMQWNIFFPCIVYLMSFSALHFIPFLSDKKIAVPISFLK